MISRNPNIQYTPADEGDGLCIYAEHASRTWPHFAMTAEDYAFHNALFPKDKVHTRQLVMDGDELLLTTRHFYVHWIEEKNYYEFAVIPAKELPKEFLTDVVTDILTEVRRLGAVKVIAMIDERFGTLTDILQEQGMTFTQSNPMTRVDLDEFKPGDWANFIQTVKDSGIQIMSLAEYFSEDTAARQKQYWEADCAWSKDIPLPYVIEGDPFEKYQQRLEHDKDGMDCWFVALDGNKLVGITELPKNKVFPEWRQTGFTGVHREYRKRGIARALKASALTQAKLQGAKYVGTDNEENNPMLALNIELGFKKFGAMKFFEMKIEE
ncbi:MAG: GNAT family N-acetyltransferase [Armatimonadetes bacterium]|nr:GNAT family N-acetyltransferase [Armatimonadota bacterium]